MGPTQSVNPKSKLLITKRELLRDLFVDRNAFPVLAHALKTDAAVF